MKPYKFSARIQSADGGGACVVFPFDVEKLTLENVPVDGESEQILLKEVDVKDPELPSYPPVSTTKDVASSLTSSPVHLTSDLHPSDAEDDTWMNGERLRQTEREG